MSSQFDIFRAGDWVEINPVIKSALSRYAAKIDLADVLEMKILRVERVGDQLPHCCSRCGAFVDLFGHRADCFLSGTKPSHPQWVEVSHQGCPLHNGVARAYRFSGHWFRLIVSPDDHYRRVIGALIKRFYWSMRNDFAVVTGHHNLGPRNPN